VRRREVKAALAAGQRLSACDRGEVVPLTIRLRICQQTAAAWDRELLRRKHPGHHAKRLSAIRAGIARRILADENARRRNTDLGAFAVVTDRTLRRWWSEYVGAGLSGADGRNAHLVSGIHQHHSTADDRAMEAAAYTLPDADPDDYEG